MVPDSVEELFHRYGPAYRWLVTVTALIGSFAMVLSATIVNVAVPSVMGAFGIGQDEAQWMATAFLATMTASQLLNAWVVQAFGQRMGFCLLSAIFLIGTLLSGWAPNLDVLIAGRLLQGLAAGIVQPMTMVTIFQVFPPDRRGMAMGIYGTGVTLAPGLGPAVGGIAIDSVSWQFVFFLPLPFTVLALFLGAIFMPGKGSPVRLPPLDWPGLTALAVALFCLLTAIANGTRDGWLSDRILLLVLMGLVAAGGFVFIQLRSRHPLLDVGLFRNPQFASAVTVAFVFGLGNFASSYVIPVFVQTVQGYTATRAGMVLLPAGLALTLAMPLMGRLADFLPYHNCIIAGLVLFSIGAGMMVDADVNTPFWMFAFFTLVGRIGMAFILPSLNAAALKALPADQLNQGSGSMNFVRQLGGAFGVNVTVVILEYRTYFHSDVLAQTQTASNATSLAWLDKVYSMLGEAGIPDATQSGVALDYMGKVLHAQANTMGFQDSFLMLTIVFALAILPALVLARSSQPRPIRSAAPAE
ncbi:MAG: DHA2 family efflux MFS transporter permease subunit [Alphaproteobacteria bacterium]|nr:DHA2 family efflux MFS transporter permease subunit [Alphaproteobacteria bacterium]